MPCNLPRIKWWQTTFSPLRIRVVLILPGWRQSRQKILSERSELVFCRDVISQPRRIRTTRILKSEQSRLPPLNSSLPQRQGVPLASPQKQGEKSFSYSRTSQYSDYQQPALPHNLPRIKWWQTTFSPLRIRVVLILPGWRQSRQKILSERSELVFCRDVISQPRRIRTTRILKSEQSRLPPLNSSLPQRQGVSPTSLPH